LQNIHGHCCIQFTYSYGSQLLFVLSNLPAAICRHETNKRAVTSAQALKRHRVNNAFSSVWLSSASVPGLNTISYQSSPRLDPTPLASTWWCSLTTSPQLSQLPSPPHYTLPPIPLHTKLPLTYTPWNTALLLTTSRPPEALSLQVRRYQSRHFPDNDSQEY
jgi:hypothetical protein